MSEKVVLAYTGGLESSLSLHWLRHKKNLRVIAFSANLGMVEEALEEIGELGLAVGADRAHVVDLRDRFAREFLAPAIRANARYEFGYYLGLAMGRALIVQEMVKIALDDGCRFLAHSGVKTGNDRARFEAAVRELAPDRKVLSPVLEWSFQSRAEEEEYVRRYGICHRAEDRPRYSFDDNLWGRTVRWGGEDDRWSEPPRDAFLLTVDPVEAPAEPEEVLVRFKQGIPVALDGLEMDLAALIQRLNGVGGRHGVGRVDMVEHRVEGGKHRQVYESPAAHVLVTAHEALEDLLLDKSVLHFQKALSQKYSDLIYEGRWFHVLREALDGYFQRVQDSVAGEVRVRLFKGGASVVGRREGGA